MLYSVGSLAVMAFGYNGAETTAKVLLFDPDKQEITLMSDPSPTNMKLKQGHTPFHRIPVSESDEYVSSAVYAPDTRSLWKNSSHYESVAHKWRASMFPDFLRKVSPSEMNESRCSMFFVLQESALPLSRVSPFCGHYGPRWACWGGFNSMLRTSLTDTAVFWPGVPLVTVEQHSEHGFFSTLAMRPEAAEIKSLLDSRLRSAARQDVQCLRKPIVSCG